MARAVRNKDRLPDIAEWMDLAKKHNLVIEWRHENPHLIVEGEAVNLANPKNYQFLKRIRISLQSEAKWLPVRCNKCDKICNTREHLKQHRAFKHPIKKISLE